MAVMDRATVERKPASRLLVAVLVVIAACAVAAAAAGFGHRFGLWSFRTGFVILRWAVYIAAGAGVVCLLAFVVAAVYKQSANTLVGIAGAMLAAGLVLPAWQLERIGAAVPRIHDITTDTDNPPAFVAIAPLREGASNPVAYAGPEAAAGQKAAYADLRPVVINLPPAQAHERALAVARDMGWDIVAADPAQGRIEATDETFWFGFKDDVVIRIVAADAGSRVDIRSKSRVGRGDFGTNAKRIRAFTRKLESNAR